QTGAWVVATFSPFTSELERIERLTPGGAVMEVREFHRDRLVIDRFIPKRERTEVAIGPRKMEVIDYWELLPGGGRAAIRKHSRWGAATQTCPRPPAPPNASALLADLSWLNLAPGAATGDSVALGNNVEAIGCNSRYPGGNDALARELTDGLRTALSCLSEMGGERQMDAASMTAFLQPGFGRPARIACGVSGGPPTLGVSITSGTDAQAISCPAEGNPAMVINSTNFTQDAAAYPHASPGMRKATMVHEMFHWLGYRHYHGFDLTYLMEKCCMNDGGTDYFVRIRDESCALLQSGADWRSSAYLTAYARIQSGTPTVVGRTALDAYADTAMLPPPDSATRDGRPALDAFMIMGEPPAGTSDADWLREGSPFYGAILGQAAMQGVPSAELPTRTAEFNRRVRRFYPVPPSGDLTTGKRAFANQLGMAIGRVIQGRWSDFVRNWDALNATRAATCGTLSANERRQVNNAADLVNTRVMHHEGDGVPERWLEDWPVPYCP
ncbi:MAG: hypothetical protein IT285_03605, partial [Bdellovibrionales bacterium]|nr:hypothetical protein [Bdellovibrionales bacterium]